MSGSGGYYKYRCKYWLTFNCPHWVWVNNAACAYCLADGRDAAVGVSSTNFRVSRDIYVPRVEDGTFHYTLMEIISTGDWNSGWVMKEKPMPKQSFPTSTEPGAVSFDTAEGLAAPQRSTSEIERKAQQNESNWNGSVGFDIE